MQHYATSSSEQQRAKSRQGVTEQQEAEGAPGRQRETRRLAAVEHRERNDARRLLVGVRLLRRHLLLLPRGLEAGPRGIRVSVGGIDLRVLEVGVEGEVVLGVALVLGARDVVLEA